MIFPKYSFPDFGKGKKNCYIDKRFSISESNLAKMVFHSNPDTILNKRPILTS